MSAQGVRKLRDEQLCTFDQDYVSDELFEQIAAAVDADFDGRPFHFLDAGSGKGLFADRLLEHFPNASATVLDNSELLLSQNVPHERKTLILASATEVAQRFGPAAFDIVFFNLALHHFVSGGYFQTRKIQREALKQALSVLKPDGRIIVTEQLYDGFIGDNLPGFLVFILTSSKALAPLVQRFGANTAGCGVCFQSTRGWRKEFRRLGLRETAFYAQVSKVASRWFWVRIRMLTVHKLSRGFFSLRPAFTR